MHGANSSGTSDNSHVKATSSSNTSAAPTVRCHFCNKLGHYKSNCRQYESLRNSPAYQARLSHPARTQLIYDHLEDSVFAPKTCPTTSCTNATCDGYHCYTSFPEDEFSSAESYFNGNLLSSVENAKLDRPMDSTPPLARSVYVAQEAYWGNHGVTIKHISPMIGTGKIGMRVMKNTRVTLWITRKIKMAMAKIRMKKFT
jgi:hypothetical protein